MNRTKKLALSLTALAFFAAGCGTQGGSGDDEPIIIGSSFELTGDISAYGTTAVQGVRLAISEINEDGGILGREIEHVDLDNQSDTTESASIATRLATQEGAVAIIGPATSGLTQSATPSVTRAEVPLITPSGTLDSLTIDGNGDVQPFIFRASFQDSFQGQALAQFAFEDLGAEKAVIIGDSSNDYAIGLTDRFVDSYEGEVVRTENFTTDDTDFSAILTSIRNLDFDVIYMPGYYEQAGLIIRQAREMGIEQPILGADGFSNTALVDLAGAENMTDIYYTAHFSTDSPSERAQTFIDSYTEEYGNAPDSLSALGYDAVYLVAQAIEEQGEATPEAIVAGLEGITDFEGVTGTFSIDENHNPIKSAVVIEMQDGVEVNSSIVEP